MRFTSIIVAIAAGMLGFFSSCTKDQSSYTMDSLQGTTTITGVVKYDPGYQETESGASILGGTYIPASNVTVNVSVPYSSLGIKGEGSKSYTVTTDANGQYTLQLPMSLGDDQLADISVTAESFYATYNLYMKGSQETSFTVVELENTLFNAVPVRDVTATRNNVNKVDDILCDAEYDEEEEYQGVTTINGTVLYSPGWWLDDNNDPQKEKDVPAIGARVSVEVPIADQKKVTYSTLVNASGEYSLEVPMNISSQMSTMTVSVASYIAQYTSCERVYDYEEGKYVNVLNEDPYHVYSGQSASVTVVRDGETTHDFILKNDFRAVKNVK